MKFILAFLKVIAIAVLALFGLLCVGAGACLGLGVGGQVGLMAYAILAGILAVGCFALIAVLVRSLTAKGTDDDPDPEP